MPVPLLTHNVKVNTRSRIKCGALLRAQRLGYVLVSRVTGQVHGLDRSR